MSMEYREIVWAEIKPDVYGGEKCDEVIPLWEACAEGDMDSDTFDTPLEFDCKRYPPGTKVTLSVPQCPDCNQDADICTTDENCSYNWNEWVENEYS